MSGRSRTTTAISRQPTLLYRWWWIWTEPFRLVARLLSERFVKRTIWSLLFSAIRLLSHLVVGNPWWFAAWLVWIWAGPSRAILITVVVFGLAIEAALGAWSVVNERPSGVSLWRLAWKFHRQWPRIWADCAAKTREIQSFDSGRHGEARAAAVRPVVDHPRMPWRFWFRWPVITFRVGVAPGRTFAQFERVISAMAANMPWVHALELDYGTDRDSFALLHVALRDVLVNPGRPRWIDGRPDLRLIDGDEDHGESVA